MYVARLTTAFCSFAGTFFLSNKPRGNANSSLVQQTSSATPILAQRLAPAVRFPEAHYLVGLLP